MRANYVCTSINLFKKSTCYNLMNDTSVFIKKWLYTNYLCKMFMYYMYGFNNLYSMYRLSKFKKQRSTLVNPCLHLVGIHIPMESSLL